MVGSDPEKFKDLADEAKLPKARQDSCVGDYSNAVYSWDLLLKSHRRTPDQPKTKIACSTARPMGRLRSPGRWLVPSSYWKRWLSTRQTNSCGGRLSLWK
jgi:hypothetical protein